jgi:hypothetical protein
MKWGWLIVVGLFVAWAAIEVFNYFDKKGRGNG